MSSLQLRPISAALLSLFAFLAAKSAGAATYYVSPSGSAGSAGTSKGSPTSVGSALGKVVGGDVVVFLDGTYTNTIYLSKSGSSGSPITLRADENAVPIIRGTGSGSASGLAATANVSNYVIEGLWLENWAGGIELDWDNTVSNITIRHCVTDSNTRNGISPYRATNVTIEYNIASRNGWGPDSWSSNFNIWGVKGSNNVVRGNVAFHGIDTSSSHSDGNGYILDLALDQGTALFENNLGFLNGGACISLTDSGGAQLVGNTCYGNSQEAASYMDEFNMGNTCRGQVDGGINVGQKPYTFTNLALKNNVAIPTKDGKDGVNVYNTSPCAGGTSYTNLGNYIQKVDATALFAAVASADFRPKAGSAIVDKVAHTGTFATDIGFDPKCIKTETDASKKKFSWWTFAPDLAYMKSKGGIAGCFAPAPRPQGANQEIGAYELAGCSSAAECDDTNPCTTDTCSDSKCAHAAVPGCCQSDGECEDDDACTSDTCNLSTHECSSGPISGCCNSTDECGEASACVEVSCNLASHTCESDPIPACCTLDVDCDDDDACTTDTCAPGSGNCNNVAIAGCCQLDGDCADDDACTVDTCTTENTCSNVAPEGCCTSDTACNDSDSCTQDLCNLTTNLCEHSPDASCGSGGTSGGSGGLGGVSGAAGTGGSAAGSGGSVASGGAPSSAGAPTAGGSAGAPAASGGAGTSGLGAGGSSVPSEVSTQPGSGCGCSVPARRSNAFVALGGLTLAFALSRRFRRRSR